MSLERESYCPITSCVREQTCVWPCLCLSVCACDAPNVGVIYDLCACAESLHGQFVRAPPSPFHTPTHTQSLLLSCACLKHLSVQRKETKKCTAACGCLLEVYKWPLSCLLVRCSHLMGLSSWFNIKTGCVTWVSRVMRVAAPGS